MAKKNTDGAKLKTYDDWTPILEREWKATVYDPDGARTVYSLGLQDMPMSKEKAQRFFAMNTLDHSGLGADASH